MITISELLAWIVLALAFISILSLSAFRLLWNHRVFFTQGVYTLLATSLLLMLINDLLFFMQDHGALFGLACLTALFLSVRIHIGRLPYEFLRHNSLITGLVSVLFFAIAFFAAALLPSLSLGMIVTAAMLIAFLIALSLGLQTMWALSHYIFDTKIKPTRRGDLPTVTLAIPARNETMALAGCLDAALQSDYQKLEILVLDDCSHDNTSHLIKSYAHAGVRFMQGDAPSSGWLGKTNAYSQLAKEASGDIIFFMGVDTRPHPETISRMVAYLDAHKLDMVSVLPRLDVPFSAAALLQNLRYFWQVVLPLTRRRVPVSSEAWAIRRSVLAALGGFSGVKHKIIPEGSFARRLMTHNRYHFVIANRILPMEFIKSWRSGQNTAVRLLYPTLKRQPLQTMAATLLLSVCGILPFFVSFLSHTFSVTWWLAITTSLLYVLLYASVLWHIQARWWWLSLWLLPFVLIQEIILILVSMIRYEFGTVDWKGRNVCYPVLLHKRRM